MNADHDVAVTDNPEKKRFETTIEGHTALVDYVRHGDTIWFTHTEVPPELEGRGIGSALAKYVLDYAVTNSLKVVPACAFIADYIGSHPEYAPLVTQERAPKQQ
ncbi:MAG: N-acetyltransferase [Gemmatimonadaceae bacterium]|nr:N-acetyltransferase [Gemmatimonadaceae bacterium]